MNTYLSQFICNLNNEKSKMGVVENGVRYDSNWIRGTIYYYCSYLRSSNYKERSRIALLGDRNLESISFFHALLICNMIPVLVDSNLSDDQIKILLRDEDDVYCHDKSLAKKLAVKIVPLFDNDFIKQKMRSSYGEVKKKSSDIVFITHTSGTTGLPKKVAYSEQNISWATFEYRKIYKLDIYEKVLFALPFHYCFGFIACCLSPLSAGKTVVLLPNSSSVEEISNIIEREKVQVIVINPYFYNELCKVDLSKLDFSSVKICDSGGDVLPIPVIEKFREQVKVLITEGYGLTETSSLTHFLIPEGDGKVRLGSVGKACDGVESLIVDEGLNPVPDGNIGELLVKGPMVIKSYDDPRFNEGAYYKDWFRTGDLFYKDGEDYYYLIGRKKDSVDIYSSLLRSVSNSIPKLFSIKNVADLAYRIVSNNEIQIYVVPSEDSPVMGEYMTKEIIASLSDNIREISIVKLVNSLPRTNTGKVIKRNL